MYEQIKKPKENKIRAVTNSVAQKKHGAKTTFQFVDNRKAASLRRKIGAVDSTFPSLRTVTQLISMNKARIMQAHNKPKDWPDEINRPNLENNSVTFPGTPWGKINNVANFIPGADANVVFGTNAFQTPNVSLDGLNYESTLPADGANHGDIINCNTQANTYTVVGNVNPIVDAPNIPREYIRQGNNLQITIGMAGHADLSGGDQVTGAGTAIFNFPNADQMTLKGADNASGHYRPSPGAEIGVNGQYNRVNIDGAPQNGAQENDAQE